MNTMTKQELHPEPTLVNHNQVTQGLDGLCIGLVTMTPAGKVSWMNRAAQRALGLDLSECQGRPFLSVVRDPQFGAFWQQALETGETQYSQVSLDWPRPTELKVHAAVSRDVSGSLIGRALLFWDVTADRAMPVQLTSEATRRFLDVTGHWNESPEAKAALTSQETRILRLVGSGLSNREIAAEVHVTPATVRSHLKHAYSKLGICSRSEAISYALRNGLA